MRRRGTQNYDKIVNRLFERVVDDLEEDMEQAMGHMVGWANWGDGRHDGKLEVREIALYFFAQGLAMGTDVRLQQEKRTKC